MRTSAQARKPFRLSSEVKAIFARDDWMRWRYNIRLQAGQAEYWLAQGNLEQAEEYARRLLETATHYEARKYIAVAHKLLAEVAVARGDWAVGEAELTTALDWLHRYPVPIVEWKTYARARPLWGPGWATTKQRAKLLRRLPFS